MTFSKQERIKKLSKANTSEKLYNLYEEIFGEEFPIVESLNPNYKIDLIIDAIELNEKVKPLKLPEGVNI